MKKIMMSLVLVLMSSAAHAKFVGDHMAFETDGEIAYKVKAFVKPDGTLLTVDEILQTQQKAQCADEAPASNGIVVECVSGGGGDLMHVIVIVPDGNVKEERDVLVSPKRFKQDATNYYLPGEALKTFGI